MLAQVAFPIVRLCYYRAGPTGVNRNKYARDTVFQDKGQGDNGVTAGTLATTGGFDRITA